MYLDTCTVVVICCGDGETHIANDENIVSWKTNVLVNGQTWVKITQVAPSAHR